MRTRIAALLLLAATAAHADEYKRGEVVDGIACVSDPAVSYAYYLPARYDARQPLPVIFVFDPRRRGAYAAELFREAAEKYGWIIVSSNNTESDAEAQPSIDAIQKTLPDAQRRFAIDTKRIYAAGFSGTAIIAWALADVSKSVTGVIGCSGRPLPDPGYHVAFNWFGTAGEQDFNYMEGHELDRGLAAAGANHRLEVFDGPHRWAPPPVLRHAIEWMELQAMKAGTRPRDEDLVKQLFAADVTAAESERDPLAAAEHYDAIVRTFDGLTPTEVPRARAAALRATREYAAAVKERKRAEDLEVSYRRTLARVMQSFVTSDVPVMPANLARDLQISTLQRLASRPTYEGRAAQRALEAMYGQVGFYAARELTGQKLTVVKAVAAMIHPEKE